MMTELTIALGASLVLFLGSLVYAIVQDWMEGQNVYQKMLTEQKGQSGFHPKNVFGRAARKPMRVLGSFIL